MLCRGKMYYFWLFFFLQILIADTQSKEENRWQVPEYKNVWLNLVSDSFECNRYIALVVFLRWSRRLHVYVREGLMSSSLLFCVVFHKRDIYFVLGEEMARYQFRHRLALF